MQMKKYKYCYQCNQSDYVPTRIGDSTAKRFGQDKVCLYCRRIKSFLSKNQEKKECPWFSKYELPEAVKEINRLRGIF